MDDLISRQAAIDAAKELSAKEESYVDPFESFFKMLEHLPSEQPQRMKGRWVRKESDLSWWYECSECGESPLFDPYEHEVQSPFCPFCGSGMRGDEDAAD